jgi:hypothetical protein
VVTRDEYMKALKVAEASTALAHLLETNEARRTIYRLQRDGLAALRNNIALGATPWER